jgi:PAS domain S-box-containing protein
MSRGAGTLWDRLRGLADPLAFLVDLVGRAPFGVLIYKKDGHPLMANDAFRALFGAEPPPEYNVFEDPVLEKIGVLGLLRRAFAGEVVEAPLHWYDPRELPRHAAKEGRQRAVSCIIFPIGSGAETYEHVAMLFRDETEIQVALRELDAAQKRLRNIIDTMPAFVYAQEADGRFIFGNRATAAALGVGEGGGEAVAGRTYQEITGKEEGAEAKAMRDHVVRERQSLVVRDLPAVIAGESRVVDLHKNVLEEADGRVSVITMGFDVTERKRSEALLQLNREMQQASRLKSEFLANMSHELRTPLNAVIGFAELLHDGKVDPSGPQHKEFLGDILASGRHLLQMVNDVLDLSKIEAGKLEFRPERVQIGALIGEVLGVLRGTSAGRRVQIDVEGDPEDTVVLDPARFKQVLYNLLSNALKFTAEEGRVTVRTALSEQGLRLEVEDTGIGIRPEDVGRLFVEFGQLDAGIGRRAMGTGLGLALTKRLVEAQGGTVAVRSTFGVGSTFTVTLPVEREGAPPCAPDPRAEDAPLGSLGRVGVPAWKGDVLVIDDDARNLRLMEAMITQLGYRPIACDSVERGMEALANVSPVAVVLDLVLPEVDGWSFVERLRELPGHEKTLVLVWTVKDLTSEDERRLGGDRALPKGDHARSLLQELELALLKRVGP